MSTRRGPVGATRGEGSGAFEFWRGANVLGFAGSVASTTGTAAGSLTVIWVPVPDSEVTVIPPLCALTMDSQTVRPMPLALALWRVLKYGSKTCGRSAAEMPWPSSLTVHSTHGPSIKLSESPLSARALLTRRTLTWIEPVSAIACSLLTMRFESTRRHCSGSTSANPVLSAISSL